jgi:hypothetical protein
MRFLFFNCRYTGKPTTKRPFFIKIQEPSEFGRRGLMQMSEASWKKYNSFAHYYCPACGKELFDHSLLENFQPVKQSLAYKFIAVFTASALLFNIISITNFIKNGRTEINTVMVALAIFLVSFLALLLFRK